MPGQCIPPTQPHTPTLLPHHHDHSPLPTATQARFKYPPHWVPLPMLFEAMAPVDSVTGQPRGFMRMSSAHMLDSLLFTLDIKTDGWHDTERFIRQQAPRLAQVSHVGLHCGVHRAGAAARSVQGCAAVH